MTAVLTIAALDLGIDKTINYMKLVCNRYAVTGGRTQIQIPTTGMIDASAGDNPNGSIAKAVYSLDMVIRATKGPKIAFGYSQGAQVCGSWMRKYAHLWNAPPADELSFLLIGNPERRYGQQPWTKKTTPDWTQYKVHDVARKGDNWADWHGKPANKFAAMFGSIHTNYWKTDPYDPNADIIKVAGNTTYVVVP